MTRAAQILKTEIFLSSIMHLQFFYNLNLRMSKIQSPTEKERGMNLRSGRDISSPEALKMRESEKKKARLIFSFPINS